MKVGFTGTHLGMTFNQQDSLRNFLMEPTFTELHHGDCIGADAQAHAIALPMGFHIIVHPPLDPRKRAWVAGTGVHILLPCKYLDRNKDIVDTSDILIAAPKEMKEILRSGTWSTIRYARKIGRQIIILEP